MVEVEQHGAVFAHLHHGPGVAALAVGRGELHHIAHVVLFVGVAQLVHQLARHPLLHVGVALAKGLAGGQLEAGTGLVRTGDVDLPVVKLGNEVLNGQDRLLKAFRELAGSDAAFLMIHDNKVYRLATLLKDKNGQPQTGVPLSPDSAEVAALRAGKPFHGMVNRNGHFYMSYFDPVLDEQGQAIAAGQFLPWLERFGWMDPLGERWWPILGAAYFLVAVKRVHGMRLLEPAWRTHRQRAAGTVPVANRASQRGVSSSRAAPPAARHEP